MGSHAQPQQLPVIKFTEANTNSTTTSWKSISNSVRNALESHGCFVVSYEKPRPKINGEMFGLMKELFDLPLETKKQYTCPLPGLGYGGNFQMMPLFEYCGIEDCYTLEGADMFANLMWPHGYDKFRDAINSYCKESAEVHQTVMKMLLTSYGLDEKHYEPLMESLIYPMRLMKYKPPPPPSLGEEDHGNKDSVGLVPHRDKSFMAVVSTNEVKGLQIQTRDGDWIDYDPFPSSFVVIVGEALMAWSNGRLYCPLHKVIAYEGNRDKYSVGSFTFVRGVLQVPEELVDDEHPLKFNSFSNFEFLEFCKDGGAKMSGAIEAYCGVR